MPLAFLTPELARWDELQTAPGGPPELLVAPFFADERPLRGAGGLADWRLCGRLSRLLRSGRLDGTLGETALVPGRGLVFHKLLLLGLGNSDEFTEARFRSASKEISKIVKGLAVRRYALPLPGRSTDRLAARRALELWLDEVGEGGEVWVVEPPSVQKDLAEALGRRAR